MKFKITMQTESFNPNQQTLETKDMDRSKSVWSQMLKSGPVFGPRSVRVEGSAEHINSNINTLKKYADVVFDTHRCCYQYTDKATQARWEVDGQFLPSLPACTRQNAKRQNGSVQRSMQRSVLRSVHRSVLRSVQRGAQKNVHPASGNPC